MESILDFSKELDVGLLDQVVEQFYGGRGSAVERKQADEVLKKFQDHQDAWVRAGDILSKAQSPHSKYLALAILDKLIRHRWKGLSLDQRKGIRNFVATMCVEWSNDPAMFTSQKALLAKADLTLVQILKQEWPKNWPQFIPEIVQSSRSGLEICENNMTILRLLSEEVFDYSAEQMTQAKISNLKSQLGEEFGQIFQLCLEVLEKASRPSLIEATLRALHRYLSWIPLKYVFGTEVIELLVTKFLTPFETRNITLKCLTEIASLESVEHDPQFYTMFAASMQKVSEVIPVTTNLRELWPNATTADQDFMQNLSLFLSIFLSHHVQLIEARDEGLLQLSHLYLIKISEVDERELFKGCLDYWSRLVLSLFDEIKTLAYSETDPEVQQYLLPSFNGGGAIDPELLTGYPLRKHKYADILSKLRVVVIEHMVRPEEVLISENEDGEIVRVVYQESDTIILYKSLRDILVYLTHLDVVDTRDIMTAKLDRQIDGSEWSWNNLNTLCWAIGSISGTMTVQLEKHFLVVVIKELLGLTDQKRGKDNKAVVASNIMYIVGQYPRFLRAHWKFLKTVVNKLFEFMHETHEGVQDMACDTFIKITEKCKSHFVEIKPDESEPFIDDIIRNIENHTMDLAPHQVQVFYEACGHIVSAQRNTQAQDHLLDQLMVLPNAGWNGMVQQIAQTPEILAQNPDSVKMLVGVIKTNTAVCTSLGAPYLAQLARIFTDMLGLYQFVSKQINSAAAANEQFVLTHYSRLVRTVKREILKLLDTYFRRATQLEQIAREIAPPLLATVLTDYQESVPQLRESEVLACVSILVEKVGSLVSNDMVLGILEKVFECTLSMIAGDMTEYPEFRVEFFKLLRTINQHSFATLLQLPNEVFANTINACLWAAKHDNRDVEGVGLSLTLEIVHNVVKLNKPEVADQFFQQFSRLILGDTFGVLTDPDHRSGFTIQSDILATFVDLAVNNRITMPLYSEGDAPPGTSNAQFLREYLAKSLKNAFPHLQDQQLAAFVDGMFKLYQDRDMFRSHLRDFLVQIKEIGGDDTEYLFTEDRAKLIQEQREERRKLEMTVGGLAKPSDLEDADL
ncbi:Exportin-1 [Wickerhamiella sorbophila]|uniref:Exportin-1 n=1 Tax=Wickerhamiella sorbophila TaxID=45607 RepID=A0A2T0FGD1_9ASCO|nr:Exportin-1 [Wickerhamiella sorbophila]PRT54062.1 Exportin-1 [Wickerhamiella sorbophila]